MPATKPWRSAPRVLFAAALIAFGWPVASFLLRVLGAEAGWWEGRGLAAYGTRALTGMVPFLLLLGAAFWFLLRGSRVARVVLLVYYALGGILWGLLLLVSLGRGDGSLASLLLGAPAGFLVLDVVVAAALVILLASAPARAHTRQAPPRGPSARRRRSIQ